jgi:transcriptional regulator with XRE-family HTH domain
MSDHLGRLVLDRKSELDLSYQDIADATNGVISKSYAERLAKGQRKSPPSLEMVQALAKALQIPVALLEDAVARDYGLSRGQHPEDSYVISVAYSGRKATVLAKLNELPDDDVRLELIDKMLDARIQQTRDEPRDTNDG